jgi:hypothetical protein
MNELDAVGGYPGRLLGPWLLNDAFEGARAICYGTRQRMRGSPYG